MSLYDGVIFLSLLCHISWGELVLYWTEKNLVFVTLIILGGFGFSGSFLSCVFSFVTTL